MSDEQLREEDAEQTATDNPDQEQEETLEPSETDTEAEAQAEEINESEPPKDNAAWAALRVENKRLKEQLTPHEEIDDQYLNETRQFANVQGSTYAPQSFDENSDIEQVSQAINQANQSALEASSRVRQLEIQLEEQEMFTQFPHFREDKLAQQLIAEKKIVSKTLGRERRYTDIAREVDKLIRKDREQVAAQSRDSERATLTQKMAAATQTQGISSQNSGDDREELRARARRGDNKASAELLLSHLDGMDFNF